MNIQKEIEQNLEDSDILDISEKIDDYIVPIDVAAKLKGISRQAIINAINKGKLRRVNGITLQSLAEYRVNIKRKLGGKIRGMEILKEKIKDLKEEIENGKENGSKVEVEESEESISNENK